MEPLSPPPFAPPEADGFPQRSRRRSDAVEDDDSYRLLLDGRLLWELPADHQERLPSLVWKRLLSWVELLALLGLSLYSLFIYFYENLWDSWRLIAVYVLVAFASEFATLVVVGVFLSVVWLLKGSDGCAQVQPASSIFLQVFHAIGCYGLFGFGCYLLCTQTVGLVARPLLLYYVIAETTVTFIYSVLTCPTVWGGLRYLGHKVRAKLAREPLVQFHSSARPNWFVSYFGLGRLGLALGNTRFPVAEPARREEASCVDELEMDYLIAPHRRPD